MDLMCIGGRNRRRVLGMGDAGTMETPRLACMWTQYVRPRRTSTGLSWFSVSSLPSLQNVVTLWSFAPFLVFMLCTHLTWTFAGCGYQPSNGVLQFPNHKPFNLTLMPPLFWLFLCLPPIGIWELFKGKSVVFCFSSFQHRMWYIWGAQRITYS